MGVIKIAQLAARVSSQFAGLSILAKIRNVDGEFFGPHGRNGADARLAFRIDRGEHGKLGALHGLERRGARIGNGGWSGTGHASFLRQEAASSKCGKRVIRARSESM